MAFVSDLEIVEWANNMVKASEPVETDTPSRSCKYKVSRSITGFKDSSISDGHFLLQLLDSIAPGTVDYGILEEETDIDRRKRTAAKYAISVSRKLGAVIFLLPEDIVEVKPRMVMTFVASLMAIYQQRASDLP